MSPKLTLILICALFLTNIAQAQQNIDLKNVKVRSDSTDEIFLYQIVTKSGSTIIGEIQQVQSNSITVLTKDLGTVNLALSQIDSIDVYDAKNNPAKRYMVGATHYLIAPTTPYGLEKGEINLQNSEIFLMSAWLGISKYFTLGGGFSVIPGISFGDQLFYLVPKVSIPVTPNINLSAQYTQILLSEIDNTSLLSFSAAFGKRDRHVSIGYTTPLFADGDDVAFDAALINIGGVYRAGNKFAFLVDINLPSVDTDIGIYGFGARYIGRSSSFDFGFLTNSEIQGIPFPWFNYTLRLK